MKNIMFTSELSYWGRKGERQRWGEETNKRKKKLNNDGDIIHHFFQGYYVLSMK